MILVLQCYVYEGGDEQSIRDNFAARGFRIVSCRLRGFVMHPHRAELREVVVEPVSDNAIRERYFYSSRKDMIDLGGFVKIVGSSEPSDGKVATI